MPRHAPKTIGIPVEEYRALKACQARLEELEPTGPVPPNPGYGGTKRSRFDQDPELAEFVRKRLGRMRLKDIVAQCHNHFGNERAPSISALHRFWVRLNALRRSF